VDENCMVKMLKYYREYEDTDPLSDYLLEIFSILENRKKKPTLKNNWQYFPKESLQLEEINRLLWVARLLKIRLNDISKLLAGYDD
jgi:hypothetical protein